MWTEDVNRAAKLPDYWTVNQEDLLTGLYVNVGKQRENGELSDVSLTSFCSRKVGTMWPEYQLNKLQHVQKHVC